MAKAKTLKKQKASSVDSMKLKPGLKTYPHNPIESLRDEELVKRALGEALLNGDVEAVKEIIRGHLKAVEIDAALKKAELSRRTFYDALSARGNPSLKTIGKIMLAARQKVS